MNIKYFSQSITTIEQLKKEYRKLAKQYHPDLNEHDTTEDMKQINKEYEYLFAHVETKADNNKGHNVNDEFRTIINELLKHNDITIDIVGSWLWVYGKGTYSIKSTLKQYGFVWRSKKKKWSLGELTKRKNKYYMSYEKIKNKYGYESFNSPSTPLINN